jgi:amino acid permease
MYGSLEPEVPPQSAAVEYTSMEEWDEGFDEFSRPSSRSSPPSRIYVTSITTSLILAMVGGGALALPEAAHYSSLLPGVGVLVLVAISATFSARLLVLCCALCRSPSFSSVIATALYGPIDEARDAFTDPRAVQLRRRRSILMTVLDVLLTINAATSVLIRMRMIADAAAHVARYTGARWPFDQPDIYYVFTFLYGSIVGSLRSFQQMNAIIVAGVLTVAAVIGAIVIVYIGSGGAGLSSDAARGEVKWFDLDEGLLFGLTASVYAYIFNHILPQVYYEMPAASPYLFSRPVNMSILGTLALYLLSMIFGYLSFGSDVASDAAGGNVLNNYPENAVWTVMRSFFIAHLFCAIPPRIVNIRITLYRLLRAPAPGTPRGPTTSEYSASVLWRAAFSVVFSGFTCVIAWAVPGVGVLVGFVGAFVGIPIFAAPLLAGFLIYSGLWQNTKASQRTNCGERYLPRRDGQMVCLVGLCLSCVMMLLFALMAAGVFSKGSHRGNTTAEL